MMRNKPLSSLQKTYDECYLICSTAIYFEAQGNEIEALRSWRSALDLIYYHHAYRIPSSFVPKLDAEKTLQSSLRDIETRCKGRIDFLEAQMQPQKDNLTNRKIPNSMGILRRASTQIEKSDTNVDVQKDTDGNTAPPANMKTGSPLLRSSTAQDKCPDSSATHNILVPATRKNQAPSPYVSAQMPSTNTSIATGEKTKILSPGFKRKLRQTLRPSTKKGKNVVLRRGPKDENPVTSLAASLAWQVVGKTKKEIDRLDRDETPQALQIPTIQNNNAKIFRSKPDFSLSHTPINSSCQSLEYNSRKDQPPRTSYTASSRPHGSRSLSYGHSPKTKTSAWSDSHAQGSKSSPPLTLRTKASVLKSPGSLSQLDRLTSSRKNESPLHPNRSSKSTNGSEVPVRRKQNANEFLEPRNLVSKNTAALRITSLSQNYDKNQEKCDIRKVDREKVIQSEQLRMSSRSFNDDSDGFESIERSRRKHKQKHKRNPILTDTVTVESNVLDEEFVTPANVEWEIKVKKLISSLPKGVHEAAAKQVLDEVVVKGDEVHWGDVAGLDVAKEALKEAVVYPFLRPDLFMGLREPARGMLLFGPPGTGKTMLARAVATESKSTFFSISASSLTSKYLGESEKLVRALFQLARILAPSIIFVDEIDSLLSARSGSGEHESTRRIKTEFFIQWSDLQRAAAGRVQSENEKERGDPSRVLVLAATNVPWAIDEAARRRFVRRQYIPLPERNTRASHLKNLLSHQKHNLNDDDIQKLVDLTEGFSGSDITALAKDAAMGPLRSLGEAMLFISMDEVRQIHFADFEASLTSIRPSVSKESLKEFEDWTRVFGERGG
ncbi:putative AAA domain-containing protein [Podosphaera aphanis]|nr:putative AAA domain-containing protein [Podosphaera aphanis]